MTSFDKFPQALREKQEKSKKRLEELLQVQGEEQIHDFRTSVRRLETTYLILPNSFKRKKTDHFVSSYKSLFKKTSLIRDFDIFFRSLPENGLSEHSYLVNYFTSKKENQIDEVLKQARKLSKLKIPSLADGNIEKILPKYEKIVFSLVKKLQDYIPVVISDESKMEELHSMRKTAKRLRYFLEDDPNDSYIPLVDKMKIFQDLLGDIHDCDITINLLKKFSNKFPQLHSVIVNEEKKRSNFYKNLIGFF